MNFYFGCQICKDCDCNYTDWDSFFKEILLAGNWYKATSKICCLQYDFKMHPWACSSRAKAKEEGKILFDVCRLFADLFFIVL